MHIRNTKKQGVLHYRIFKWQNHYVGICLETGFVEESVSIDAVRAKLTNGTVALLRAVGMSKQNLEDSLNTRPPLKYHFFYHIAPLLASIEMIREGQDKSATELSSFISFKRSIMSFA